MQVTSEMYLVLFNAISDATELIESGKFEDAAAVLKNAQQKSEDLYIEN